MTVATDFYELLGVSRSATAEEIKKAYRRRAREIHPDANPGDAASEAAFKELGEAYEVLSDPGKRQRYDQFGIDGVRGNGAGPSDPFGFGGITDIFDAFFGGGGGGMGGRGSGGPPSGADLEAAVEIDFEAAVFGVEAPVQVRTAVPCDTCEATGAAPGTHAETCSECGGVGQVRRVRQSILGQMVTSGPCNRCGGVGQVIASSCPDCGGEGRTVEDKTYNVDIPAGVDTGSTLRLGGLGAVGPRGGAHGDLYVHVRVRPHERFEREGDDIFEHLHIPFTQAALGAELVYETLDGTEQLSIDRGTQSDHTFRLRGKGAPHVRGRGRGDLLVTIVVDVPADLDAEQDALLRQLAEQRGEEVAPVDHKRFSRLRSAFK